MLSILLTSVQFVCLGIILYINQWVSPLAFLALIQVLGLLLGGWAILAMSRSKLNVTPVPRKGSVLITDGPYRLIRHPMYTSLFLIFYPILYTSHSTANLVLFSVFTVNMILKLNYEEKLLLQRFEGYREMTVKTWRLIPWIY